MKPDPTIRAAPQWVQPNLVGLGRLATQQTLFLSYFWWGWAETTPTHNPHGCWPDLAIILIKLLSAYKTNSLYAYRG